MCSRQNIFFSAIPCNSLLQHLHWEKRNLPAKTQGLFLAPWFNTDFCKLEIEHKLKMKCLMPCLRSLVQIKCLHHPQDCEIHESQKIHWQTAWENLVHIPQKFRILIAHTVQAMRCIKICIFSSIFEYVIHLKTSLWYMTCGIFVIFFAGLLSHSWKLHVCWLSYIYCLCPTLLTLLISFVLL